MEPNWLKWAKELQAIAQNGLTFSSNGYDTERYTAIQNIAAEVMASYGNVEKEYVLDLFSRDVGYATPKVDVRGVVFRDGDLLCVREREDNLWTLPGGWADINECPSEAVAREVFEESGYETRVVKLLAVYDRSKHGHVPVFPYHVYKLFFLCELTGGMPKPGKETSEVLFFGEYNIPMLSLSRVTPQQTARFFEHYRNPNWPTDFD
jgi:ADP-ribose pyrophosphatase YjhB (NUDIX family)